MRVMEAAHPTSHASPPAARGPGGGRNLESEVTSAMGGALFGVSLAELLSVGTFAAIVLLVAIGGVGWYAAYQANKSRR